VFTHRIAVTLGLRSEEERICDAMRFKGLSVPLIWTGMCQWRCWWLRVQTSTNTPCFRPSPMIDVIIIMVTLYPVHLCQHSSWLVSNRSTFLWIFSP